ncbi:MAG: leucine-rich repeat protein [Clostridiales bacterium]|nr:leucine-rich repeat protein [Clostridiales bacterium]
MKKIMKKRFALLMGLLLIFGNLSGLNASASDINTSGGVIINGTCGDNLTWTLTEEGVLTISGIGEMYDYYNSSDGYAPWSSYRYGKKSVVIEKGVTSIGSYAFENCTGVASVSIPDSVKSIGSNAFYRCSSLTDITIPNSITDIGDNAFFYCTGLVNITIPNSVKSIGDGAFMNCGSLTSVTIPSSVKSIGSGAFVGCDRLTSVSVSGDNGVYSSSDGVLFNKDMTELIYYPTGITKKSYTIPEGTAAIDSYAFVGCTNLTHITIPDSITSIGSYVFENCTGLTAVNIPSSVTSIGDLAFYYCSGLKEITIPNSVVSVGSSAFAYCTGLNNITISNGITAIEPLTFYECSGLTDIIIPEGVTAIGENAFENCTGLISVTIPRSMKSIGREAFTWLNMTDVYYGGTEEEWNSIEIGSYNSSLTEAKIHYTENEDYSLKAEEAKEAENIYDDNEADLSFDSSRLDSVADMESVLNLVDSVVSGMSEAEVSSVKAKDQLAYLCEEAAARAATVEVEGDIVINDEIVREAAETVSAVVESSEKILAENGVHVRSVRKKVRVSTSKSSSVYISKENLSVDVDAAEAVTPFVSFEFEPDSVSELRVEDTGLNTVSVSFDKHDTVSKVTVKFPGIVSDDYKAVTDEKGNVIGGKHNPITEELSAKIDESGVFTVITNEKDFEDIKSLPIEVQEAIKKLASKGIIKGTSETEFSPESYITRAEIAALTVRILGVDDPEADGGFTDVTKANWYFGSAGSSKRENIITGYEDNTFRGTVVIPKVQIMSAVARTLTNKLGYFNADESVLSEFTDAGTIADWARSDIALAAYANMVIRRTDGSFEPEAQITRGDAAVILEKLFDKVW